MSKIKNVGLDQYGTEPLEQQQFGTAGIEGVNEVSSVWRRYTTVNNMKMCDLISNDDQVLLGDAVQ